MNKKLSIEWFKDKLTLWKLTSKGFYKFEAYLDNVDLKLLKKKYRGYEIKDKTGHIETQVL